MLGNTEKGFTLVEIAIVMTIIAFLVGGILKSTEMINNAERSSTIVSMQSTQIALNSFYSRYKYLAGDMPVATTKISNCDNSNNCTDGDGNNLLSDGTSFSSAMDSGGPLSGNADAERWLFWKHLALSDLVSGIEVADNGTGKGLMIAEIGGYFTVGRSNGNSECNIGNNFKRGLWLILVASPFSDCTSDNGLAVKDISIIDRKIDDGKPDTGIFRAGQSGGSVNCVIISGTDIIYDRTDDTSACNGAFFLQ